MTEKLKLSSKNYLYTSNTQNINKIKHANGVTSKGSITMTEFW